MENSIQRMKELVEILNQAAKAYYQEDREIFSPETARCPSAITRPEEISTSASLLEQKPASLKYLLILIFSSIFPLYSFPGVYARQLFD